MDKIGRLAAAPSPHVFPSRGTQPRNCLNLTIVNKKQLLGNKGSLKSFELVKMRLID